MATWSQRKQRGYSVAYSLTIEGIPWVFSEANLLTVEDAAPSAPSGYLGVIPALAITEGMSISIDANREEGIADGRALDILLSAEELEAYSYSGTSGSEWLFSRPTASATLSGDVTDSTTTTIPIDSIGGLEPSGYVWLGRECIYYPSESGTSLDTVTRGVCGYPHLHLAASTRGYRTITDRPVYWRGRIVTVYEHLVSPEGRLLADSVGETATDSDGEDISRQLWLGFVDSQPQPVAAGMQIRTLPLVRLLGARDLGVEVTGTVSLQGADDPNPRDTTAPRVVTSGGDAVTLTIETGAGSTLTTTQTWDDLGDVGILSWSRYVLDQMMSDLGAGWSYQTPLTYDLALKALDWIIIPPSGTTIARATVQSHSNWFVQAPHLEGTTANNGAFSVLHLPIRPGHTGRGWLPVYLEAQEEWSEYPIPSSGVAIVEAGGVSEAVYFAETEQADSTSAILYLHITRRGLNGVEAESLWEDGASVSIVSGMAGRLSESLLTVLESSGQDDSPRGSYDALGLGMGLGMDDGLIDEATLESYPYSSQAVAAVATGTATAGDLFGGWMALMRRNLVQRRMSDGSVRLTIVGTDPADDPSATTLDASNVLIGSTTTPEAVEAPTEVRVSQGVLDGDAATVVRDLPRCAAEGVTTWEISAPGCTDEVAVSLAGDILARAEGQALVTMAVAPWVEAQVGDLVAVETAHPVLYSWADGSRGPSSILARVLGWERDLYSDETKLTCVLSGHHRETLYLCPSATVLSTPSTTEMRVTPAGIGALFLTGDVVTIYTPGNDGSEATYTVASVVDSATYDTITTTAAHGAAMGDIVTFAPSATATERQGRFLRVSSSQRWI